MIVLDRKKILMIVIGIFCFSAIMCTNIKQVEESILTSSTPVTEKVVVLDAGHGKPDEGAQGVEGVTEEKTNLEIVLKLQKLLEESGATVILTRSDENAIYDLDKTTLREMKVSDIKNRVKIGNESSADLFVSIHLNNFSDEKYYGWQTFYKGGDENSKKLADAIQKNLNKTISNENKRVTHTLNDIYIMKHVEIPIALVECGFLSNPEEATNLQNNTYQLEIAWGIYDGIMDYFAY